MQYTFDYGQGGDIAWIADRLEAYFGAYDDFLEKDPICQLVRSLIANRTRDHVSDRTFDALRAACRGDWNLIADLPVKAIESLIRDVTFPEIKAPNLKATLQKIRISRPDYDLSFLKTVPESEAQAWLESHAGVGAKVSSAILNFSTLAQRSFVADTHILRVFVRYGLIEREDADIARQLVTGVMPQWTTCDLRAFHYWVKRLGQEVCTANLAKCGQCPIADHCQKRI